MANKKLIECVTNISSGDKAVVKQVVVAIEKSGGKVLDTFSGTSTNRSVVTIAAEVDTICQAAFAIFASCSKLIDMRMHRGTHPRIGAVDVCPFIPLHRASMEDAKRCALNVAQRAWDELKIPSYLYAFSTRTDSRKLLSAVRKGEYESIPSRIGNEIWTPDFGDLQANSKVGVSVIGARDFLIAYNINLTTSDVEIANKIAFAIRESGAPKSGQAGMFRDVSAIGWHLSEKNLAQISINIRDFRVSPIHRIFEACSTLANKFGTSVTGSELVGLIPQEALELAGKTTIPASSNADELLAKGAEMLGLSEFEPFVAEDKILEKRLHAVGLI